MSPRTEPTPTPRPTTRKPPFVPAGHDVASGTLKAQLTKLGLHSMAAHCEAEADRAAKSETTYTAYLTRLVELELADKADRSINARIARARFPVLRTLEAFDFGFQPGLPAARVRELANLAFLDQATNVLFIGGPGVGKTHLAIALALTACAARRSVLFTEAPALLDQLVAAEVDGVERGIEPAAAVMDQEGEAGIGPHTPLVQPLEQAAPTGLVLGRGPFPIEHPVLAADRVHPIRDQQDDLPPPLRGAAPSEGVRADLAGRLQVGDPDAIQHHHRGHPRHGGPTQRVRQVGRLVHPAVQRAPGERAPVRTRHDLLHSRQRQAQPAQLTRPGLDVSPPALIRRDRREFDPDGAATDAAHPRHPHSHRRRQRQQRPLIAAGPPQPRRPADLTPGAHRRRPHRRRDLAPLIPRSPHQRRHFVAQRLLHDPLDHRSDLDLEPRLDLSLRRPTLGSHHALELALPTTTRYPPTHVRPPSLVLVLQLHSVGQGRTSVYSSPLPKVSNPSHTTPLAVLLHRLNRVLRGWATYFRHGVSKATFDYVGQFTWSRVLRWLHRKHQHAGWTWLRRRYLPRWWPTDGEVALLRPSTITVSRYRYRGRSIPSPWAAVG